MPSRHELERNLIQAVQSISRRRMPRDVGVGSKGKTYYRSVISSGGNVNRRDEPGQGPFPTIFLTDFTNQAQFKFLINLDTAANRPTPKIEPQMRQVTCLFGNIRTLVARGGA